MAEWAFGRFDPQSSPYLLMLLAAAGLGISIFIGHRVSRREGRTVSAEEATSAEKPLGKEGGFKLVFTQRYLLLIAILILLMNVVNTTGGFILDKVVTIELAAEAADDSRMQAMIGQFYGSFYGWQNLLGFLIQLFLVSRVFKYIGIRGALFVLPCLALGSYALFIAAPVLAIIRIVKLAENSTDYSHQNTVRRALFLPTSREAKYKAKTAIDTFFWRLGDMLQAGVVFVGVQLAFAIQHFAIANLIFVGIWLLIAWAIAREHKRLSTESELQEAA